MSEKKVLIITYYWPPSGGSGVQRWLKFVKYLPHFGYTPYVFTPENPSFDLKDESLLKDVPTEAEVIHFPIWEPYHLFFSLSKLFAAKRKSGNRNLVASRRKGLFEKVSTWVRGNLIIPDPRVFWVRPSVSFLEDFIKDNQIRAIITTGPPHSVHLIGLKLKKKNPALRWIADFRDPWSEWGLLDSLHVGKIARRMHRSLERKVLHTADKVITITPFYGRRFSELSGRKADVLTNGFDEEDFRNFRVAKTEKFIIRHVGIVNEKCDPRPFMLALRELYENDSDFRRLAVVDFIGDVHPDFKSFVELNPVLTKFVTFTPAVPHRELIHYYEQSSVLVLILTGYKDAEGYMPGKLFEYIATGLPVLGLGPVAGDASTLINSTGVGRMIDSGERDHIVQFVREELSRWKNGAPSHMKTIVDYSRKGRAKALADMLDQLQ